MKEDSRAPPDDAIVLLLHHQVLGSVEEDACVSLGAKRLAHASTHHHIVVE